MNNIVLAPIAPFWEEEETSRGWELSSSEPGELAWTRQWPRQGTLHYISLPPRCHTVWRRQNNYGRRCRTRQLQKNYSECISYEHVIRSVIQNPKALSCKILERGGDEMKMCVCVCVYECVGGGGAHIWVCRYRGKGVLWHTGLYIDTMAPRSTLNRWTVLCRFGVWQGFSDLPFHPASSP